MQIILVGQPELDRRLKQNHLRQLAHRIVFSYRLPTLHNYAELLSYLCFRLNSAGYKNPYDSLFSPRAIKLLLKASRGIPRLVNILCHKSLLITYGYNRKKIDTAAVKMAIADTESVAAAAQSISLTDYLLKVMIIALLLVTIIGVSSQLILKLFY